MDLRGLGIAAAGGVSSCAVFASVNCSGTISDSGFLVAIILQTLWLESCYQWAVCDTASASAPCLQFSFTRFVTGHQSPTVLLLLPHCFKLGSNEQQARKFGVNTNSCWLAWSFWELQTFLKCPVVFEMLASHSQPLSFTKIFTRLGF